MPFHRLQRRIKTHTLSVLLSFSDTNILSNWFAASNEHRRHINQLVTLSPKEFQGGIKVKTVENVYCIPRKQTREWTGWVQRLRRPASISKRSGFSYPNGQLSGRARNHLPVTTSSCKAHWTSRQDGCKRWQVEARSDNNASKGFRRRRTIYWKQNKLQWYSINFNSVLIDDYSKSESRFTLRWLTPSGTGCWDGSSPLYTTVLLYYTLITVTMWFTVVKQLTPVSATIGRLLFRNKAFMLSEVRHSRYSGNTTDTNIALYLPSVNTATAVKLQRVM